MKGFRHLWLLGCEFSRLFFPWNDNEIIIVYTKITTLGVCSWQVVTKIFYNEDGEKEKN